jgi:hypothetical protein
MKRGFETMGEGGGGSSSAAPPPAKRPRSTDDAALDWQRFVAEQHLLDPLPLGFPCEACVPGPRALAHFIELTARPDGGRGHVRVLGGRHGAMLLVGTPRLRGLKALQTDWNDMPALERPSPTWTWESTRRMTVYERMRTAASEFGEEGDEMDWNYDADRLAAMFARDPGLVALVALAILAVPETDTGDFPDRTPTFLIITKRADGMLVMRAMPTNHLYMACLGLRRLEREHPDEVVAIREDSEMAMSAAVRHHIIRKIIDVESAFEKQNSQTAALTSFCQNMSNSRYTTRKNEHGERIVSVREERNANTVVYEHMPWSRGEIVPLFLYGDTGYRKELLPLQLAALTSAMLTIGTLRPVEAVPALTTKSDQAGINTGLALGYNVTRLLSGKDSDSSNTYCCTTDRPAGVHYTVDGTRVAYGSRLAVETMARSETA